MSEAHKNGHQWTEGKITHKHVEDSFKDHTFKEITSAIQTPIREISVAIVLQNQAINMQRVSPFIRHTDTEL
jgi:hypothetical protein